MRLLSRAARRRFGLDEIGDASHTRLRELAHAINAQRSAAEGESALEVHAGELGALLLLQDLLASMVEESLRGRHPKALAQALAAVEEVLGRAAIDALLEAFVEEFGTQPSGSHDDSGPDPQATRMALLEALLVLWQINRNPALRSLREFFDDRLLPAALYAPVLEILEADLRRTTAAGGEPEDLIARLEAPARTAPQSIAGQLSFFLDRPEPSGAVPRPRLERALDALREERVRPPAAPGPIEVPELDDPAPVVYPGPPRAEPEWMQATTLLAKHTFVWLDQLSLSHQQPIARLDEVPDAALAELAAAGLNALWLVGVWERSPASRRIKRLGGDTRAEASAYSIFDYRVARELGGDEALEDLQERALEHGVRIGVDVVPNHFGLDSRWLLERPELFLAVDNCPFPGYTFDGPDLSSDPEVGIYLEDHYYDKSDAAVVFRHLDRRSGRERFIYHGNDGTSTPWNDTAQLDYSSSAVRMVMRELIVDLARRFRVLRFDAAMTLTRMHFQRLWFPAPGSGGAVPSRSEHGMSSERFARAMPREFWLDVVERVDTEAPDTLLIAEAFWLMEPYFVRQLGMHRVYNSAFMHLLREGANDRLQRLLHDTAERDPEFLRRSVNFMSTPDEASAAAQFGSGDRYFGVCTLLSTLPGLPLFGHGQVEGLAEKYGMEFRRPRTTEAPQAALVARHQREIAPLLADRKRFAQVESFRLLDCVDGTGRPQAEVYAFRVGRWAETRIVAFNNSPGPVRGSLRAAAAEPGALAANAESTFGAPTGAPDGVAVRWRDSRLDLEFGPMAASGELELELAGWQAVVLSPRPEVEAPKANAAPSPGG